MSGSRTTASHHIMFQKKDMNQPQRAYEELKTTVMLSILLLSLEDRNNSMNRDARPARKQVTNSINIGIVLAVKNKEKILSGLAA